MTTRGLTSWLDGATPYGQPLAGSVRADVVVIGGGFTGLWTALHLTDRDPTLDVVVLEAEVVGYGASGRNGGFVDTSLTHGVHNGFAHYAAEMDELTRLGVDNYAGLVAFVEDHGIDCHLASVGSIDVATQAWQLEELEAGAASYAAAGERVELFDADRMRKEVDSPTYLGGLHRPDGGGLVDPGALVRGLARVARERGVTIHERSAVTGIAADGPGVAVSTAHGTVRADNAVLATNAYSHRVLPSTRHWFVPVHDYVLLTEPLSAAQLGRLGWESRQGLSDAANQFHYYRLTPDDRILWGGYDAIYRYGNGVGPRFDHRRATYDLLAANFRRTFPQLGDVAFDRWWGGPIATTTRFTVMFGDAMDGRVVYALGYTGLGVAATRFAGRVLTDKLLDPGSGLLDLEFTSSRPLPFPPEPFRYAGIQLTRRAIARSDRRDGRRGPWLRALDLLGVGFDS